MRAAGQDIEGVEGMPMTLLIVMVVLAITVPLIFGSFSVYDRQRVEQSMISELEGLIANIQLLYLAGPGNSALLSLEAENGMLTSVQRVTLGDVPGGALSSTARYVLGNRPEVMLPISSPSVPVMSADEVAFEAGPGTTMIKAECTMSPHDLDGDGVFSDLCVLLSISG